MYINVKGNFTYGPHTRMQSLRCCLRQTQKESLDQTIKLSQSLSLKESIKTLRGKFYSSKDDKEAIDKLISMFLGKIKDPELKAQIECISSLEDIQKMMCDQALLLSIPHKQNLENFVYQYFFESIIAEQNETARTETFLNTNDMFAEKDRSSFVKAFKDRNSIEKDIERDKKLAEIAGSGEVVRDFKIKSKILNIVDEHMINLANNIAHILQFLLTTRIKEESEHQHTEIDILGFLREKVILEQITDFSSERLLKRFSRRLPSFQPSRAISDCRQLKYSTINTIGEFILMALGIISPQMFKLYNFSISPEKIDNLIKNSDYTRDELASLFKQYNLRGINGEPIFYNRRYTQHQIPSKEADTLVKDFIENIKNHRDEIFRSFGYEEFERIIIRTRRNTGLHIEERYDTIIEELNKRLENETFMKTITQILANYKYKDTYNLIKPRNSVVKNI